MSSGHATPNCGQAFCLQEGMSSVPVSFPKIGGISPPQGSCDSSSCHMEVGSQEKASTSRGPTPRGPPPPLHTATQQEPRLWESARPEPEAEGPKSSPATACVIDVCPYLHSHEHTALSLLQEAVGRWCPEPTLAGASFPLFLQSHVTGLILGGMDSHLILAM